MAKKLHTKMMTEEDALKFFNSSQKYTMCGVTHAIGSEYMYYYYEDLSF